ncbi:hypothetical protein BH10ACT8_BH10ACT8_06740 [soil metagenome]
MTRPLTSSERQRLRNPANLWRALIPLLVIIALAVFFVLPRGRGVGDGVHVIDANAQIAAARTEVDFALLVPTGLPAAWRPTNSQILPKGPSNGASLRIGYNTPDGKYAEFIESDDAPDAVSAEYGPLTADNPVMVGSTSWEGFRRTDGRQLIRHTSDKVTVVVTGSAAQPELASLAQSLMP